MFTCPVLGIVRNITTLNERVNQTAGGRQPSGRCSWSPYTCVGLQSQQALALPPPDPMPNPAGQTEGLLPDKPRHLSPARTPHPAPAIHPQLPRAGDFASTQNGPQELLAATAQLHISLNHMQFTGKPKLCKFLLLQSSQFPS